MGGGGGEGGEMMQGRGEGGARLAANPPHPSDDDRAMTCA